MFDDLAFIDYSIYAADVDAADQFVDGAVANTSSTLRDLCGEGWEPVVEQFLAATRLSLETCFSNCITYAA